MIRRYRNKFIDSLEAFIWIVICFLLLTGGYRTRRFELAQIDVFAFLILLIGLRNLFSTEKRKFFGSITIKYADLLTKYLEKNPIKWVFIFFVCHVVVFTWTLVNGHFSFKHNAFDLGYMDQAVWSTAFEKGVFLLKSTLSRGLGTYLSEHFSPILILLAPLYWLWNSVHVLFVVQSVILASGAVLLFYLCHHYKISKLGCAILPLGFLLFQPLKAANLFSFREDVFFVPLLMLVILLIEKDKWRWFWFLVPFCFGIKENAPIVMLLLAGWIFLKGVRFQGLVLAIVSLIYFWILNSKITPYFSVGASNTLLVSRLGFLGNSFSDVLSNVFFHPFDSLQKLIEARFSKKTIVYLFTLLLPFIFFYRLKLSRHNVSILILGLLVGMNLLITAHEIGFHYECILIPFLFLAALPGYFDLEKKWGKQNVAGLFLVLILCVYGRSPVLTLREWWPNSAHLCLSQVLKVSQKVLSASTSISTQSGLYTHLDHRSIAQNYSKNAELKEDLVFLSSWSEISSYPNLHFSEEMRELSTNQVVGYKSLFQSSLLSVYCKDEKCHRFSDLEKYLRDKNCLVQKSS